MIIYNNLGCNNIEMPTTTWWTRESRTEETSNQKSIVDYILWKKNNMTEIENLEIDEDLTHTLRGGKKLKGKFGCNKDWRVWTWVYSSFEIFKSSFDTLG